MSTKAELDAEIEARLPTNMIGFITATAVRQVLEDIVVQLFAGTSGSSSTFLYNTVAAVEAATIDSTTDELITAGYYNPGDGGGALYVRASSVPSHNLYITSNDGAIWSYGENDIRALAAGCKFDGITDDLVNLRKAIRAAMIIGTTLILPPGTAVTSGKLGFNGITLGITKRFAIKGAGNRLTLIQRGSAWTSNTPMEFDEFHLGFVLEDFAVSVNNTNFSGLQHGLIVYRSSHVRLNRMRVTDFTETGFLLYCDNTDAPTFFDVISSDSIAEGSLAPNPAGGAAGGQSGHELANMYQSGFNNCIAHDILNPSPGVGIQLKNNCSYSWISGGLVQSALNGTSIGTDSTPGSGATTNCSIDGVIAQDVEVGFIAGISTKCAVNLPLIDCNNRTSPGRGVMLQNCQGISVTVDLITNFHLALHATGTATDNDCVVDELWNDDSSGHIAFSFEALTDRNRFQITRYGKPTGVVSLNGSNLGGANNQALYSTGSAAAGLIPIGTNVVSAQLADAAVTGGNTRGVSSVDLQTDRTLASQVAGGHHSVIIGGQNNSANTSYAIAGGFQSLSSGIMSVAIGSICTADNDYAWSTGNRAVARATYGKWSFASGRFGTDGDAQIGMHVLRAATTNATPVQLSSNGVAASPTTSIALADNSMHAVYGRVVARRGADGVSSDWDIKATIKRGVGVGTTALIGTATVTLLQQDGAASAWVVAVTADATNGGLAITVTGDLTSIHWGASINTMELG